MSVEKFDMNENMDSERVMNDLLEFKKTVLESSKENPEQAEDAEFLVACVDNALESLKQLNSSKEFNIRAYASVVAHMELITSGFMMTKWNLMMKTGKKMINLT